MEPTVGRPIDLRGVGLLAPLRVTNGAPYVCGDGVEPPQTLRVGYSHLSSPMLNPHVRVSAGLPSPVTGSFCRMLPVRLVNGVATREPPLSPSLTLILVQFERLPVKRSQRWIRTATTRFRASRPAVRRAGSCQGESKKVTYPCVL